MGGHSRKMTIYKPGREASGHTKPVNTQPWTSSLQNCEETNFYLSSSVYIPLLWKPYKLMTKIHLGNCLRISLSPGTKSALLF